MQLSGTPLGCKRCQRDFTHKSGLDPGNNYDIKYDIFENRLLKVSRLALAEIGS